MDRRNAKPETDGTTAEARDTALVGSLVKGFAVIECFGQATPRLSIADVAARTGFERATARRFLLTLVKTGYADYDGKYFTLTPRVLRLGYAYLSSTPLPAILQRVLEPLLAEVDESLSAATLDDTEIVYIARAAHRRVMSIGLVVGSRLPAYCSSMGRVLLAALPADDAQDRLTRSDLRALTPNTLTTVDAIMAELAGVRAQGYATVDQELETGLVAIAVPVYDAGGRVVAAINCGSHVSRATARDLTNRVLPILRGAQATLRPMLVG